MSVANNSDTYNKGGMIAFVFCMVFSLSFFVWVSFLHPGVDLGEVKASTEAKGVEAKSAIAAEKVDVSAISKPWEYSDELSAHGKQVYKNNCAVCHGSDGLGDGPAGKALVPPPRNFKEGKWTVGGDRVSLFTTISKGIEGTSMAAFGHLPKIDRWAVVHFIRSITQNKVSDNAADVEAFAASAE